jgi:hypothetical protein
MRVGRGNLSLMRDLFHGARGTKGGVQQAFIIWLLYSSVLKLKFTFFADLEFLKNQLEKNHAV